MVVTIKSTDSPQSIDKMLKRFFTKVAAQQKNQTRIISETPLKKFDAKNFNGILPINLKENPVELQRKWRAEWD